MTILKTDEKLLAIIVFVTVMRTHRSLQCNCLLQRNVVSPKITSTFLRYVSTKLPADPPPPLHTRVNATPQISTLSKSPQKFEKLFNRTPKFLRKWLQPIANKPLSHITSFLILHEVAYVVECRLIRRSRQ